MRNNNFAENCLGLCSPEKKGTTLSEMPQPQIRSVRFAASVTSSLGSTWSPSGRGTSTGVGTLCGKVGEAMVVLLMVQKSGDHHLGCKKSCEFNGISYQPQLVSINGRVCRGGWVGLCLLCLLKVLVYLRRPSLREMFFET